MSENHGPRLLMYYPHFRMGKDVGGVQSWQQSKYLARLGYKILVVAPAVDALTMKRMTRSKFKLFENMAVEGVDVCRVWCTSLDREVFLNRLFYIFSQSITASLRGLLSPKPDVVMAASEPITTAVLACVQARLRGAKYILEMRDLILEGGMGIGYIKPGIMSRLADYLYRRLYLAADIIVVVSPGIKDHLVGMGIPEDKIKVITHAFEPEIFNERNYKVDVRKKYGWEEKFIVVYAGVMGHVTDIMTILKAAEALRDREEYQFVLIGGGQKRQGYIDYCEEKGLDNCSFLGWMPRQDLPDFYRAADVCVNLFPDRDGINWIIGHKTFDYLGSGTPYIFGGRPDSSSVKIVAESGGGINIPPGDEKALAQALLKLQSDDELREEMGKRGRKYILENYTREKIIDTFDKELKKLLAR